MIFAVAHGKPNSCGPGCSEWIAAEGMFDHGAAQRFLDFLANLEGRKLPIFFNSAGGITGPSYAVGRILRERGMTAAIGATIPEGCKGGDPATASCRRIMRSSRNMAARLVFAGAKCHSACVLAFLGASVRHVPEGALVGVHAAIRAPGEIPTKQQVQAGRELYVGLMCANPELVSFAASFPANRIHILTREEIERFRIDSKFAAGCSSALGRP